ncbi:RICIN domain-containing protein [Streptomyces goshikiensis]|uniref:RICIN domain-containing protein n=1 Tax=Streptomyces goshikiensis TaxID=1942 RepID=UPI0036CF5098
MRIVAGTLQDQVRMWLDVEAGAASLMRWGNIVLNVSRWLRRVSGVVMAVAAITIFLPASSASASWTVDTLYVSHSTKCLEIADWRTDNGAPARQWSCGGKQANQAWVFTYVGDSANHVVSLKNAHSGKCLEIADWRTDNGAPARQFDCTGGENQQFYLWPNPNSSGYALLAGHSDKCLEVADWSQSNGAGVRQWTCGAGPQLNQLWQTQ